MKPLEKGHINAKLECPLAGLKLKTGESITIPVLVRNISQKAFDSDPPNGIFVSYQWFTENGNVINPDSVFSTPINPRILPGESSRVMARVKAPGATGTYLLKIVLVQTKCFSIAEIKIPLITVTENQQREYANLFENAIDKGNLSDALVYYKRDRSYFGVGNDDEKVLICRVMGVKEWCNIHSLPYKILDKARPIRIFPPYRPGQSKPLHSEGMISSPELYVAEVRNVSIIGGQEPVLVNNDIALFDEYPWAKREDDTIFFENGTVSFELKGALIVRLWKKTGNTSDRLIEKGIFFCGMYTSNYFHWMVDFLSRFWAIDQCPEYRGFPIIINDTLSEKFLEALKKIDTHHREIIQVEHGVRYTVKNLVIPSIVIQYHPQAYGTYKEFSLSPVAIRFLRERFGVDGTAAGKDNRKKIYIQRKEPLFRNLLNEKEIEDLFERHGFEFIDPSKLNISEQIEVFSSAAVIAGPHGAGWTNMIFAPLNVQGLMLLGPQSNYLYSNIAHFLGQDLIHIHGECIRTGTLHDKQQCDYAVNVEEIGFALDAINGRCMRMHTHKIPAHDSREIQLKTQDLIEIPRHAEFSVDMINRKCISDEPIVLYKELDRRILIEGWAIDSSLCKPAAAVFISFESGQEYRAYYSIYRPDVAAHFGDKKLGYTGFTSAVSLDDLSSGIQCFRIKIVSSDRKGYYCSPDQFFIRIN